ncbi:hypothetical protein [Bradyrhizobium sp. STM 3557]|uniref:hypothetical protein n=1 Tax=Bradyrhizobium sp. STM 3557 TaxID=578920 RepID=UPI0038905827
MVSEISFTIDGITTTTITYSDGTTETETSGSAKGASASGNTQGPQTYNAQGLTSGASSSTNAASS